MRIKLKQVNDIDIFTHPYIFIYLLYIYIYKLSFIIRCLSNIFYFTVYYIILHVAFNVFCSYLWIITMVCIFIYMLYELLYRQKTISLWRRIISAETRKVTEEVKWKRTKTQIGEKDEWDPKKIVKQKLKLN